jgi:LuxR family transcriptional regulator, maltose regulon positive regulatory protein
MSQVKARGGVGNQMAEADTRAAYRDAAGRKLLLATKIRVPAPRPGWVSRPRLLERLRASSCELVLVCGPAGFGKSSLLADWVRRDERAVGWLSLDEGDNDPVRFWRHVAAALDGARAGLGASAGALVGSGRAALDAVATALVNEFAEESEQVVLVVDDYHLVEAPEVHRSLEFLLEHLPPALRLVVASRTDPPLPLARMRVRGQLTEIRASALRFTVDEAAEMLRAAVGDTLPDTVVAALGERTEGWVAGLQLAALSLRGRTDSAGFVAEFSGSHRYVLDYLTEEVLDRQPEELRTFLLETSVLERLSGPLCDAVLGRGGSQELLESVERANLFLLPLDSERRWYHQLFTDMLRARLLAHRPGRVAELHRAAAAWYERKALADEAISHALAAGDFAWAARLVEEHFEEMVWRLAEGATLFGWLAALPPEVIHQRPRLTLGHAVNMLMAGRLDQVEPLLTVAELAYDRVGDEPYRASIGRKDSILANVPAAMAIARAELARLRCEPDREIAFAQIALAHMTERDELLGSMARYQAAFGDWLAGRVERAERALGAIFAERVAAGLPDLALRSAFDLGAVQQAQGRLGAALATYRRGLDVASAGGSPPTIGMAHVGLAEVLYERDELAAAAEHAMAGIEQCRRLAYVPSLVTGLLALARICGASGDRIGALEALDEAHRVMPDEVVLGNPVPAMRARLLLAGGNVAEAAQWARQCCIAAADEPSYPRESDYLVLARVLLAENDPVRALELLERWRALAVAQGRTGSLIPLQVLTALALAASGQEPAALTALADALALAAPEGYLRVFLDEGEPLAALVRELLMRRRSARLTDTGAVPREFLAHLSAAFDRAGRPLGRAGRRGSVAAPGLLEPLSARELEVLVLVAAGHANREIAGQLYITVDTVKRHISHIFDKLDAANRTQAVARARELGLLDMR